MGLLEEKRKLVGFDYTNEEECLKAVKWVDAAICKRANS